MMDSEIDLPVYSDMLSRLAERVASMPGPIIDTSCGSGHMLSVYHERWDPERALVGIDLSPRMVAITKTRLGSSAAVLTGDMCQLPDVPSETASAVLSFFAVHHLDPEQVEIVLVEWRRVLHRGGQLLVAAWEGGGSIDYGAESDVVALRYAKEELEGWVQQAGFAVEPVEEIPMEAVYLEGTAA